MSSSDAVNEANAALESEKLLVELRMPGSFDFGDRSSPAARLAGVGTIDLFDAVGMLGNLWRRMQMRDI